MKNTETIHELLQGCRIGTIIVENYSNQVEDETLKKVLNEAITTFKHHEEWLRKQTHKVDELNLKETLVLTWGNLKAMTFTSDQQFLEATVDAIATALNTIDSYYDEELDESLIQIIQGLEKDYRKIYDKLMLLK